MKRSAARLFDGIGQPSGDYAPSLVILQGAVAFVLLIACANVAGLLLARGTTRQTELALRMTLGAGRRRIVRQVMTESLPLALLGAALGVCLAWLGLKLFLTLAPAGFPHLEDVSLDLRVLGFTAIVALTTSIVFAVVPAMQVFADYARRGVRSVEPDGNRGGHSGNGRAACWWPARSRSRWCYWWAPA